MSRVCPTCLRSLGNAFACFSCADGDRLIKRPVRPGSAMARGGAVVATRLRLLNTPIRPIQPITIP